MKALPRAPANQRHCSVDEALLTALTRGASAETVTELAICVDTTDQPVSVIGDTFPRLAVLRVADSILSTLRDLGTRLRGLRVLDAARCRLTDLAGIGALTSLEELYLRDNFVADLSALSMHDALRVADLSRNEIAEESALVCLGTCGALRLLCLEGNPLASNPLDLRSLLDDHLPDVTLLEAEQMAGASGVPSRSGGGGGAVATPHNVGACASNGSAQQSPPSADDCGGDDGDGAASVSTASTAHCGHRTAAASLLRLGLRGSGQIVSDGYSARPLTGMSSVSASSSYGGAVSEGALSFGISIGDVGVAADGNGVTSRVLSAGSSSGQRPPQAGVAAPAAAPPAPRTVAVPLSAGSRDSSGSARSAALRSALSSPSSSLVAATAAAATAGGTVVGAAAAPADREDVLAGNPVFALRSRRRVGADGPTSPSPALPSPAFPGGRTRRCSEGTADADLVERRGGFAVDGADEDNDDDDGVALPLPSFAPVARNRGAAADPFKRPPRPTTAAAALQSTAGGGGLLGGPRYRQFHMRQQSGGVAAPDASDEEEGEDEVPGRSTVTARQRQGLFAMSSSASSEPGGNGDGESIISVLDTGRVEEARRRSDLARGGPISVSLLRRRPATALSTSMRARACEAAAASATVSDPAAPCGVDSAIRRGPAAAAAAEAVYEDDGDSAVEGERPVTPAAARRRQPQRSESKEEADEREAAAPRSSRRPSSHGSARTADSAFSAALSLMPLDADAAAAPASRTTRQQQRSGSGGALGLAAPAAVGAGAGRLQGLEDAGSLLLGRAAAMPDAALVALLRRKPKHVPELSSRDGFRRFFAGMARGRLERLLREALLAAAEGGDDAAAADDAAGEDRVARRLALVRDLLVEED